MKTQLCLLLSVMTQTPTGQCIHGLWAGILGDSRS